LRFEKSQRSVTHDSLRYINILTYLLTYLHKGTVIQTKLIPLFKQKTTTITTNTMAVSKHIPTEVQILIKMSK